MYYCDRESGHEGVITGIIPPEHKAHEGMTADLRLSWDDWHRSSPRRATAHKNQSPIDLLLSKNGAVVRRIVSRSKRS